MTAEAINTFKFSRKNSATTNGNKNTARSINIRNAQLSPLFLSTLPPQAWQYSLSLKRPSVMPLCWQSRHKPFKPIRT